MKGLIHRFVHDLKLRHKLNLVVVVACMAVLLLASAVLFAYQEINFRIGLSNDIRTTAQIIAANSVGPITFKDAGDATAVLGALQAKPFIANARIELKDGTLFARWSPTGRPWDGARSAVRDGLRIDGYQFLLAQPITSENQRIGTLYLLANARAMHDDLLKLYGGITGGVLLLSLLVGFGLSTRLQRFVSEPILALAATAHTVAEQKDYSVRAPKLGGDEVGRLTDAFNQMLGQIQEDAASLRSVNRTLQTEIAERERVEAAQTAADQRFRLLTESAHDAILSTDQRGRIISWNQGAQRLFGYGAGDILGESITALWAGASQADYRQAAESLRAAGVANRIGQTIEMQGLRSDGREFPIELSLFVWLLNEDVFFGVIVRDTTERKRAAEELEKLNMRLRDTSRQAGMAEVATGVLHNVGNVLNSVNISATLISDRVRSSKAGSLGKLSVLFKEHRANLGAFLTSDPRGQRVPDFINQLAEHLVAEQSAQIEELQALCKNVDHIKEIVAMQQSYATVSGVIELIPPATLVEDALRINLDSLAKDQIEVVRAFGEVPSVSADRHKVMQILVNLIRNARHALRDARAEGRRITLGIARSGDDRVKVEVSDNGVGIPPENLTRIFQHGFTTKKDGHGFGLHSGANAAREMGGQLTVHSDGPSRGATFTLELPLSAGLSKQKAA